MGLFNRKSKYERHDKKVADKASKIVFELMNTSQLRELCKNLIGSVPRDGLVLRDNNGKKLKQFYEPFEKYHYHDFLLFYMEKGQFHIPEITKYVLEHKFMDPYDKDWYYLMTHDPDGNEIDFLTDDNCPEWLKKLYAEESKHDSPDWMMEEIIEKLETSFDPDKVFDEKELQNMIRMFLQTTFPSSKVERESRLHGSRNSVDILVDDQYAIEVKIPNNRTELRNLSAQLEEYKDEYPDIITFILDNEELNISDDIREYVEKYKSKFGIESVVKKGKKRG